MDKTLLFDCDGVLLDTLSGVQEYVKQIHPNIYEEGKYIEHWEFFKDKQDLIVPAIINWQKTHHFANIPPFPGAIEAISKLKKAGYKLIIITSAGTLDVAYKHRVENLNKFFGNNIFDDLIFVDWNISKNTVLKNYNPTFFIEDTVNNALASLELGHKPILLRDKPNQKIIEEERHKLKDVPVFDTWQEITEYILSNS